MAIIYCKCGKDFHQDLAADANAFVMTDHRLMVIVVIALGHMQEATKTYPTDFWPLIIRLDQPLQYSTAIRPGNVLNSKNARI